jgi:hypothetical protein
MEDVTPINYFYGNDLEGLILHEIGHALGLAHPPTGLHSTMYVGPGGAEFINRIPSNDDIAGLRRIYGPATIPGDFNLDGQVDGADLAIWQPNFSTTNTGYLDTGDADNDGDVDGADFVIWQTHASANALPATSTVPEPSAIILMASVIAGILVFRISIRNNRLSFERRPIHCSRRIKISPRPSATRSP